MDEVDEDDEVDEEDVEDEEDEEEDDDFDRKGKKRRKIGASAFIDAEAGLLFDNYKFRWSSKLMITTITILFMVNLSQPSPPP